MRISNEELAERITFGERNETKDVFKEVDLRVRKRMSADAKLNYRDAIRAVCAEDEDLHRLWVNSTPPLHHDQEG